MNRLVTIAVAALSIMGCAELQKSRTKQSNAYQTPPFYAKYLIPGVPVDDRIQRTLDALKQNPRSAQLHNELGALLVQKGFPKDAEREFERALNIDSHYYQAWYNAGLVRTSRGETLSARHAFARTIALKPGHAAALFQLGLIEEAQQKTDRAIDLYAKAFTINPSLLDVDVNPRILDTRLVHLALIRAYPAMHAKTSMQFQGAPTLREYRAAEAASPQAAASDVVTPAPPVTDAATQSMPHAASVIPIPFSSTHAPAAGSSQTAPVRRSNGAISHPRGQPRIQNEQQPRPATSRSGKKNRQPKNQDPTAAPVPVPPPDDLLNTPDSLGNNPPDAAPPPPAATSTLVSLLS